MAQRNQFRKRLFFVRSAVPLCARAQTRARIPTARIERSGCVNAHARQAGDLLVQISGDECRGLAPDDAAALLRGTENTKVGIVAERPAAAGEGPSGKGEKLDLIVTRRKFKVEGVISKETMIDGRKVGVRSFSAVTAEGF